MDLNEARKRLRKLAKGEYMTIAIEVTEAHNGNYVTQNCRVYIHGYGSCEAPTWKGALAKMKQVINPKKKKKVIVENTAEVLHD